MTTENENQEEEVIENINSQEQSQEENFSNWKIASEEQPYHETVQKLYDNVDKEIQVEDTETRVEEVNTEVEQQVKNTIDEQSVMSFLKEKGFNAETLEDLKPKETKKLTPELEKFFEYQEQTGNTNYDDFKATQKDWSEESKENVLKMVMKIEKPYLTDEDIDLVIQDKYATEELDEYADQYEIRANRLKEIALKEDYQHALGVLEKQKEQYMVRKGFDESVPEEYRNAKETVDNWNKQQEEGKNAFEQGRADFMEKTNNVFTQDFEGFKVNVGGQEFKVKPEDVQATKNHLSDLDNFSKKFYDESGKLKEPTEYYKALYFAMNPDKMADHFINVGKAMQEEANERESKNITVQNNKSIQSPISNKGIKWTVVKD
jgi:hypothetical protein